jgi:hypothetical protein
VRPNQDCRRYAAAEQPEEQPRPFPFAKPIQLAVRRNSNRFRLLGNRVAGQVTAAHGESLDPDQDDAIRRDQVDVADHSVRSGRHTADVTEETRGQVPVHQNAAVEERDERPFPRHARRRRHGVEQGGMQPVLGKITREGRQQFGAQ